MCSTSSRKEDVTNSAQEGRGKTSGGRSELGLGRVTRIFWSEKREVMSTATEGPREPGLSGKCPEGAGGHMVKEGRNGAERMS